MPDNDGLFIVFKFGSYGGDCQGELNTGSYNGGWGRKPPARTYNKRSQAKMQWTRYQRDGYGARVAEISMDEHGGVHIDYCDQDWVLKPELCKYRSWAASYSGGHQLTCYRRKGHSGIHWSGPEAKRDPDFDPEKETSEAD